MCEMNLTQNEQKKMFAFFFREHSIAHLKIQKIGSINIILHNITHKEMIWICCWWWFFFFFID